MVPKVLLLVCTILLLTGCWDRREINDVALPLAMGIDYKDEKINVTLYLTVPKSLGTQNGGTTDSATYIQSSEGENIGDALSKLQVSLSRKVFLGHTKIFIIGSELAKHGIDDSLDFLLRYPETRFHAFLYVTNGTAEELLQTQSFIEDTIAEEAKELAKSGIELAMTLKEFAIMNYSPIRTAILPLIEVDNENKKEEKAPLKLKGSAIFTNGKMIEQLDEELTRGLLWLRDEINNATVSVKPEEAKGAIVAMILHSRTKIIPKIMNDTWSVTVQTLSEDDIIQNSSTWSLLKQENVLKAQKELEKSINERMEKTLKKIQTELKTDVIGFSEAFRKKYPKEWKKHKDNWQEKFSQIVVETNSTVLVKRIGQTTIHKEVKN